MNEPRKKSDRIGIILYCLYWLLLLLSLLIIGRIVYLQTFFTPNKKIAAELTPPHKCLKIEPVRGEILDCKGRVLAISTPSYQIYMDCSVLKAFNASIKDPVKAKEKEDLWLRKADTLSIYLAKVFPEKNAAYYRKGIRDNRAINNGYVLMGHPVNETTLAEIKKFPLFRDGANKGGLIVKTVMDRKLPYGNLAKRTIGHVKDKSANVANSHIGIEGRFDKVLSGTEGREWRRKCDYGLVRDFDSTYVEAVNGDDVRLTLDIDWQEKADRILRSKIEGDSELEAACFGLMDVQTGALKVVVNLMRDPSAGNRYDEISNIFINRRGEPGSVYKTVTLAALLADGKIKSLEETIPTNGGWVSNTKLKQDPYIPRFESRNHTNRISMFDGFKISSNYVLATWAINKYGSNPLAYADRVQSFGLCDPFTFDIAGLSVPSVASPRNRKYWSNTDLGNVAYGYASLFSPIYTLMFYNAIAGKGRLMKPYLVEDIENDGVIKEAFGPAVLKDSIFSRAVADTLTRALKGVVDEGTAKNLKNSRLSIAGKTGTSRVPYDNVHYQDPQGRIKYQATFVGFFPAEKPRYTAICVVYSKLRHIPVYGNGIPATTILEFINELERTDPEFAEKL
ncbi:MAG: hypothetical protein J5764_02705 [Bacteroidales bacterium]|nr:hypothetical protein [Bacteroidales bacterium]